MTLNRIPAATFLISLFALAALLTAGCGVSFDSPPVARSNPSNLSGTWTGTMEDGGGVMHEVAFIFNSAGQITTFIIDGAVQPLTSNDVTGFEGTTKLFQFSFNNNSALEGGIVTDGTFNHAGFLYEPFNAGVLQKTNNLAFKTSDNQPYLLADISAATPGLLWTGSFMQIEVDGSNNIIGVTPGASNVTIVDDGTFTGTHPLNGSFLETTPLTASDPVLGQYAGAFIDADTPAITGPVTILITRDRNFLGSYACDGGRDLLSCDFFLWERP